MKIKHSPYLISIVSIVIIFLLHYFIPTMMNGFQRNANSSGWHKIYDDEYGISLCLDRLKLCEFYRRPLMYQTQIFLFNHGIPYQFSFVVISFLCFFLTGFILYKIASLLKITSKYVYITLLAFYLHFTILFAFFDSMSTYDEPFVYLFLSISIYLLLKKGLWYSFPFFVLACLGRESSFFILPVLFFYSFNASLMQRILYVVLSVLVYAAFFKIYVPESIIHDSSSFLIHDRIYAWKNNFNSFYNGIQSVLCMFLSTGLIFYLLFRALYKSTTTFVQKRMIVFTLLLIIFNNMIVLGFGLAAEARLFSVPLVLGWALVPVYFQDYILRTDLFSKSNIFLLSVLLIIYILFVKYLYHCYESNIYASRLFKLYTVVYLMFFSILVLNDMNKKSKSTSVVAN